MHFVAVKQIMRSMNDQQWPSIAPLCMWAEGFVIIGDGQADSGQRGLVVIGDGQADCGHRDLVVIGNGQGKHGWYN
jgi:hypothetical protein